MRVDDLRVFRPKPPGPAGLPRVEGSPFGESPPKRPRVRPTARRKASGRGPHLPWWLITGWMAVVFPTALLLKPLNHEIGRRPATIAWLVLVVIGTFMLREWLSDGRLERIDAGWIGAPGRAWGRFHDRFEYVFVAIGGIHALLIVGGVLYGIADTGPVARAIVVGSLVLLVPATICAWVIGRRDLRRRARRHAERELRYAQRANVRNVDDLAR